MFSSVFDKVVSATAPEALTTFPPRADLPASASTLCCLSFADRFISHYPMARGTIIGDDIDGGLLLDRTGPSVGIAISTDDLEATMESAAELGGRLAAALAGTVRSKRREPASASVPDLLTKVRGIFGNRLACVGREIRVSRNVEAERDETLLLRQVHALKNAALDACNGEKWCLVVSSDGESLVVCSVPLPSAEEGGAYGCDFLVFDPAPRPAMKLYGSSIVKFTTVRGLQLHLLSALGEIWRGGGLPLEGGTKKEFVGLSVVMKASGRGEQLGGRRQLHASVTSVREAEKAAAIKTKREEVEALRRALEKSSRQPKPILTAPMSGGMFGLTDGAKEAMQGDEVSDLSSGPPSFRRNTRSYRQQQPPRINVDRSSPRAEALTTCDGDVEQAKPKSAADAEAERESLDVPAASTTPLLLKSTAPHVELGNQQSQGGRGKSPEPRSSPGNLSQLRPPVADVSPPLSRRTPERKEKWRRWSEEDYGLPGKIMANGEVIAVSSPKGREDPPPAGGQEGTARVEAVEHVSGRTDPDEALNSDNPLHRALLRSIEGEELAEYSKRAYSIYRAHGVIQDGAKLDDYPESETTANGFPMPAKQQRFLPATSPPASPASIVHDASRSETIPTVDEDHHGGARKECDHVGMGVRDAVTPFSPPPSSSPQRLRPEAEEHSVSRNVKNPDEPPAPTNGHELRVMDFSEAEDIDLLTHKPDKPASSPPEKFRSRLRVPCAGRALALASANVRGKRGSRRKETSLGPRHDVSGEELLLPPPPSSGTTTVPPRRKEAWTKERGEAGYELPDGTSGHAGELAYSAGLVVVISDEDEDEDEIVAHSSGAFTNRAAEHSKSSPGKRQSARERKKNAQDMEAQARVADRIEAGRDSEPEHSFSEEYRHANSAEMSKGWPMDRPTTLEGCGPTTTPVPRISPKGTTPRNTSDCGRRRGKTESHVPRSETVSDSNTSLTTLLVAPPPVNTRGQGLHRRRNGEHGDGNEVCTGGEGVGGPGKAPDDEEFVWFGQPDTPSGCQPGEDIRNPREDRDGDGGEEGSPAAPSALAAPAAPGEGAAPATVELELGPLESHPHQQQRAKAQLLLQMEVRRQRTIIERAFRAREEERRVRRARIGAEVFKRIQDLRRRRPPSPSTVPTPPPTSGPKHLPSPTSQECSINDDKKRTPQEAMDGVQNAAATSRPRPEQAVKAWGFRPALPENPAKTVQSERLAPDATPPEVVVAVGEVHPVESLVPVPPPEFAHRVAAAADNPWRRVVSRQELASPPPAKQEPTPPPIRFNVESNAFGDDLERPGGRMNLEQEKARRQERYEGLRARKMAEAEERRRGQKQRQAATREEQRRKTAAAAAAAAVTDKAQHGQDTIQDPMRQNIVQHGVPFADGPSSVRDHRDTPPTSSSAVRPRSSSLATNDDGCTRQGTGVGSLGGSNGSGKGRPRLSAPGACSVASPPVRGFSRRSNRKLVRNAISFLCLAGGHLEKKKARVLEALDSHPASNFVVLLAHTKLLSFKGLYACSGEEDGTADRVFGLGPPHVDATMVSGFYKYNSAAREFREVHSKSLGKTTDAVSMEPTRLKRPKIMVNQ